MAGPRIPHVRNIATVAKAAIDAHGIFGLISILPWIIKPIVGTSIT
jgi:hypothetical protein